MCFICDKPARAFVKATKGHSGYFNCERCTLKGLRYKNRIVFPGDDCSPRTNETFRKKQDPFHHTGLSPLELVPQVDMVKHFVLEVFYAPVLSWRHKKFT